MWVIAINMGAVFSNYLASQSAQDSTSFYYKSIIEIKDVRVTAKAFDFFQNKAKQALSVNDTIKAANYMELISFGQFKMGALYESESTSINALSLLDAIEDELKTQEARERLSNQLGMLYRDIEDFDNALKYYDRALELNDKPFDKIAIVTNIANVYADQNQYEIAVNYLLQYYDEVLKIETSSIKATYLDNLGYFQSKLGNSRGIENMELALDMRKEIKDLTGLFSSYRHFSLYFSEQGNKEMALKYSDRVKIVSDSLGSESYQLEALKLALQLEHNPVYNKYLQLSNSIVKAKQQRENKYAAIKYDFNEKERQIVETELKLKSIALENEEQKRIKFVYLFLGVLLLLASVFLYFFLKSKYKKEKLLQVYKTETRISKKVHDEVANDIYHVMTKLQHREINEDVVLDDLEHIYTKTRDISKESRPIDFNEDFKEVLKDLLLAYNSEEVNVITKGLNSVNWKGVTDLKKTAIYRVIQELMTNMKKHSKASIAVLTFQKLDSKLNIKYSDNGVGSSLKKHNGLQNAENRIKSIHGTIIFESNKNEGFKVKITI